MGPVSSPVYGSVKSYIYLYIYIYYVDKLIYTYYIYNFVVSLSLCLYIHILSTLGVHSRPYLPHFYPDTKLEKATRLLSFEK